MKFITVFTIASLLAGAHAAATPEYKRGIARMRLAQNGGNGGNVEARNAEPDDDFETSSCVPSDCSCAFIDAGLFCGDGLLGCKKGNVYQCSGGTKSCSYGKRKSCQECNALKC